MRMGLTVDAMKSRLLAMLASSAVSCAVLLGLSALACLFKRCVEDDAAARAGAVLDVPLLAAYVVLSWLLVYPAMLWLRRRWGRRVGAALAVSVVCALLLAALLHMPAVDGAFWRTAVYLVPWFATPWFVAGLCAIALWPVPAGTGTADAG
jgi:hypothetical protein